MTNSPECFREQTRLHAHEVALGGLFFLRGRFPYPTTAELQPGKARLDPPQGNPRAEHRHYGERERPKLRHPLRKARGKPPSRWSR